MKAADVVMTRWKGVMSWIAHLCPAWMSGGMFIRGLIGILLVVLLVFAIVKLVRS